MVLRDWSSDVCSSDLGNEAGGRLEFLDGKSSRVAGVRVADRGGFWRGLVNRGVGGELARALPGSRELVAFDVDHRKHVGSHETLADAGGRDDETVGAEAGGDVAAVAIAVFAGPDAAADVAEIGRASCRERV